MSRRQYSSQRRSTTNSNPYQNHKPPLHLHNLHHHHQDVTHKHRHSLRRTHRPPQTTIDIGLSDSTTDTQTYDHYYHQHHQHQQQGDGFQHSPLRDTDVTLSEDSGSTRLPYFEFDDESNKRYSRNTFSDRGSKRPKTSPDQRPNQIVDLRKVYPNQDTQWDQLYQEIQTPCDNVPVSNTRRIPTRMSERPQSSMSSGMTSAIVHGCGGKCQTFENICYFFLQLVFTMGILIGVSLCIAGIVLRKSAARNLQVLVYIGVLLALVSGLLLSVQCDARATARRRKKTAQRAAIPLGEMGRAVQRPEAVRPSMVVVVAGGQNQRLIPDLLPQVHPNLNRPLPYRPTDDASMIEEPGIPWWRRKDNNTH